MLCGFPRKEFLVILEGESQCDARTQKDWRPSSSVYISESEVLLLLCACVCGLLSNVEFAKAAVHSGYSFRVPSANRFYGALHVYSSSESFAIVSPLY